MGTWYIETVVHAVIVADSPQEAVDKMCDQIRAGIGEEPPEGTERLYRTAIAASRLYDDDNPGDVYMVGNEAWFKRQAGYRT